MMDAGLLHRRMSEGDTSLSVHGGVLISNQHATVFAPPPKRRPPPPPKFALPTSFPNDPPVSTISLAAPSPKLNNRESELNSQIHHSDSNGVKTMPASPKFCQPFLAETEADPVEEDEGEGRTTWEYHAVTLQRVPGYGFGIAVSGGRDNPHFKNGDPSVAVSDVLEGGPAYGQLQVNDRILSANGISLENADYNAAVQIMKDNEQLNLIIKRRVPLPTVEFEQRTLKFTLTKSKKKDDFGLVLGCKFYIKDIRNPKLLNKEPGLKEGDTVLRVNGQSLEDLTLPEAMRLLERSKEKLSLVIQRDVPRGSNWRWGSQTTLYERLGSVADHTPKESPRASPMLPHRYPSESEAGNSYYSTRLNNGRIGGGSARYPSASGRMVNSEYGQYTLPGNNGGPGPSSAYHQPQHPQSSSYYYQYPPPPQSIATPRASSRTPPPTTSLHNSFYAAQSSQPAAVSEHTTPSHYGQPRPLPSSMPPSPAVQPPAIIDGQQQLQQTAAAYGTVSRCDGSAERPRHVQFNKGDGGSVGVRVIGGNDVGIFVSAVQSGSPAAQRGVQPGDKILQVNGRDMRGVIREEAVLFLMGLQDRVDLVVQSRRDEYERVREQNIGDNFYIRAHFDHGRQEATPDELGFTKGDIFQVVDTLYGGTVGKWLAVKVSSPHSANSAADGANHTTSTTTNQTTKEPVKGVIPNAQRAEKLALLESTRSATLERKPAKQSGGAFFRRKMAGLGGRRTKSLTKGAWDEIVFGAATGDVSPSAANFPAYERVKLKQPGFLRPVVLFGPLADVARELLLRDFPLRFAGPLADGQTEPSSKGSHGIVKLSAIREVMNKNKHCVLDVTPASVEKLQYAQYCPVVIFVGVDSRQRLRDLRAKAAASTANTNGAKLTASGGAASVLGGAGVSTRKLIEQGHKIQKHYPHLLTATLDATKEDGWFEALRDLIGHLQERRVWMAETATVGTAAGGGGEQDDEFLFPMMNASRYSTSNYDSDGGDSIKGDYSDTYGPFLSPQIRPQQHLNAGAVATTTATSLMNSSYDNNNATMGDSSLESAVSINVPPTATNGPLPSARYANYNGYNHHHLGSQPAPNRGTSAVNVGNGFAEIYENREQLNHISHFATLRRPIALPVKSPRPPATVPVASVERPMDPSPPFIDAEVVSIIADGATEQQDPSTSSNTPPKPNLATLPPTKPRPKNFATIAGNVDGNTVDLKSNSSASTSSADVVTVLEVADTTTTPCAELKMETAVGEVMDGGGVDRSSFASNNSGSGGAVTKGMDGQKNESLDDARLISPQHQHNQPLPYQRFFSEPGYYDVKQILAEHAEEYGHPGPPSANISGIRAPVGMYPTQQSPLPNHVAANSFYEQLARGSPKPASFRSGFTTAAGGVPTVAGNHPSTVTHRQMTPPSTGRPPRPHAGPPPPVQVGSMTVMNPAFREHSPSPRSPFGGPVAAFNFAAPLQQPQPFPPPAYQQPQFRQPTLVARASSMPTSRHDAPPQPNKSVPPPAPKSPRSPAAVGVVRLPPIACPAGVSVIDEEDKSDDSNDAAAALTSTVTSPLKDTGVVRLTSHDDDGSNTPSPVPRSSPDSQKSQENNPYKAQTDGGREEPLRRTSSSKQKPPIPQKPASLSSTGRENSSERDASAFDVYNSQQQTKRPSPSFDAQAATAKMTESSSSGEPADEETLKRSQSSSNDSGSVTASGAAIEPTVIAHVSGVFDGDGGTLTSEETGVSLTIPAGALPTGCPTEIYFKVCRDPQIAPPMDATRGETLLSPLVMCGPQGLRFDRPVLLRLPHSASSGVGGTTNEQWSFALKSASGVASEWKQVMLADNDSSQGTLDEKCVTVQIDHF